MNGKRAHDRMKHCQREGKWLTNELLSRGRIKLICTRCHYDYKSNKLEKT